MPRPLRVMVLSLSMAVLGVSGVLAEDAKAEDASRLALTCVGTDLGVTVVFHFRWGEDAQWEESSVDSGHWRPLTFEVAQPGGSVPQLQIGYDKDMSESTSLVFVEPDFNWAERDDCEKFGRNYDFLREGDALYLAPADQAAEEVGPAPSAPEVAAGVSVSTAPDTVIYETAGNLEATMPVGCVGLEVLTSEHTPADIYHGVWKCIQQGEYAAAVKLRLVAYAYGLFDMRRVTDTSAHQALGMLDFEVANAMTDAQKEGWAATPVAPHRTEVLGALQRMGRPTYYPRYMIQHGLNAIAPPWSEKEPDIVPDFDAEAAWKTTLEELTSALAAK